MSYLFVLPFFISIYYLSKGRQDIVLLNVYLPCLILTPAYYAVRIPHLPAISAAQWALIPLAVSLLIRPPTAFNFRRLDLWVALFMMSCAASEILRETSPKDGITLFISSFIQMFLAYVVGRRLIGPMQRLAATKKIVTLFLCLTPLILYEYRFGQNLWGIWGAKLFNTEGWVVQLRDGHARVAASFGDAELAGILFFIAFLLNCSLVEIYKRDKIILGPRLSRFERYRAPALLFLLFLFLTSSRGPLASAAVGYLILQIPRFRNMKVGGLLVASLLIIGGVSVYSYLQRYTSPTVITADMTEQQTSAIYRRQLLENYDPVLKEGGWLGWGMLSFPRTAGQTSIDNDYLLIQLAQGKLGLYLFLLIIAESTVTSIRSAFAFRSPESRYFAFVITGSLLGLFVCIYTVYLGEQVVQFCFLLLGWSQSLRDESSGGDTLLTAGSVPEPKYRFKRVFN